MYNKVFSGLIIQLIFRLNSLLCGILFKNLILKRFFLINYTDLNLREFFNLNYLILPVIFLGINPAPLLVLVEADFLFLLTLL